MTQVAFLRNLSSWIRDYSGAGIPDQKAVENFIECESVEAVRSLGNELRAIANGMIDDGDLDRTVGMNRKLYHRSYQEWAKAMLLWIANYKR